MKLLFCIIAMILVELGGWYYCGYKLEYSWFWWAYLPSRLIGLWALFYSANIAHYIIHGYWDLKKYSIKNN